MNSEELQNQLTQYLKYRESQGYRYTNSGILTRFVQDYVIDHPGESVQVKDVLEWITLVRRTPQTQSSILSALRRFLGFVKAVDPATSIPGKHLLPSPRRSPPFILSTEQLQSIMQAATTARPRGGLRADAYVAVLGLLASSGLRIGEALHLKATDIHLQDKPPHVIVRETKFKKSRIVPLRPTTAGHLKQYADRRGHKCHARQACIFFVTDCGQPISQDSLWRWFSHTTGKLGLHLPDGRRPTLHSLRHTFVVQRLTQWYEEQAPVMELFPNLSVYLGHVGPSESYWYVSATPELLGRASDRFSSFATSGDKP